jgi:hypothetical protein
MDAPHHPPCIDGARFISLLHSAPNKPDARGRNSAGFRKKKAPLAKKNESRKK